MAFFLNISNHPSTQWSTEQLEAVQKIALQLMDAPFSKIIDVPFPEVPPEAGIEEVDNIEDQIIDDLRESNVLQNTVAAMVQGEFTLTSALVRRLQEHGIRVYAATTQRIVEIDAEGRKISTFKFVRFRVYPNLTNL